jgi:hypothetical protein
MSSSEASGEGGEGASCPPRRTARRKLVDHAAHVVIGPSTMIINRAASMAMGASNVAQEGGIWGGGGPSACSANRQPPLHRERPKHRTKASTRGDARLRRKRVTRLVVGGRPPEPPLRPAGSCRRSALVRASARPRICSLGTAHANFGNALGEISELAKGARYFNSYNWNLHTPTPHSLPPQGVLRRRRRGHSGCFFVAPPAPSALRPLLL